MAITWNEVGIFKGAPAFNGNATLTRLGSANKPAGTGVKKTSITAAVAVGDHLWAAWGSQATTVAQERATLADELQIGTIQSVAGRISTVTSPTAWAVVATSLLPAWIVASLTTTTDQFQAIVGTLVVLPAITPPVNATNVTTNVTNVSYAIYLGRSPTIATGVDLLYKITTAAA